MKCYFCVSFQALIQYGVELNCKEINMGYFASTPLYITIAYHHWECFQLLLVSGADPDYHCRICPRRAITPPSLGNPNSTYESLYHTAVRHKAPLKYVELLYEYGASLYFKDDKDRLVTEIEPKNDVQQESIDYLKQCFCKYRYMIYNIR